MIRILHCSEPWFSFIQKGQKRVEGRKNSAKYHSIKPGDQIRFFNGDASFLVIVTEIRSYQTLEAYLQDVGIENALPGIKSLEEAVKVYLQWSTKEEICRLGFLGIFVELGFN
jgi:ASC-1-like (ASCH) protein